MSVSAGSDPDKDSSGLPADAESLAYQHKLSLPSRCNTPELTWNIVRCEIRDKNSSSG